MSETTTEAGFPGRRAAEIVGITYRQLDYWARTDLVRPSLADARGSGSRRLYSYRDLLELKVIKNLLDAGIKLETVREAFTYLRDQLGEDVTTANLVIGEGEVGRRPERRGADRSGAGRPGGAQRPPARRREGGGRRRHRPAAARRHGPRGRDRVGLIRRSGDREAPQGSTSGRGSPRRSDRGGERVRPPGHDGSRRSATATSAGRLRR
ncbi:MAG: MerR family transcriptional regulator [Acidimicrobiia bacterium]|nr:MerR family transcriptional regulator [Acidimicrobiia bacterium]